MWELSESFLLPPATPFSLLHLTLSFTLRDVIVRKLRKVFFVPVLCVEPTKLNSYEISPLVSSPALKPTSEWSQCPQNPCLVISGTLSPSAGSYTPRFLLRLSPLSPSSLRVREGPKNEGGREEGREVEQEGGLQGGENEGRSSVTIQACRHSVLYTRTTRLV